MALTREQVNAVEQEFLAWMKDGSHIRLMTLAHHVSFLIDTIRQKDAENKSLRNLITTEIGRGAEYQDGRLVHLSPVARSLRQALADIDAEPERANVGDVIRSKQDSRIEYTVGYVGSEYAFESPQKAPGTWMLPHGDYSIVSRKIYDTEGKGSE